MSTVETLASIGQRLACGESVGFVTHGKGTCDSVKHFAVWITSAIRVLDGSIKHFAQVSFIVKSPSGVVV